MVEIHSDWGLHTSLERFTDVMYLPSDPHKYSIVRMNERWFSHNLEAEGTET